MIEAELDDSQEAMSGGSSTYKLQKMRYSRDAFAPYYTVYSWLAHKMSQFLISHMKRSRVEEAVRQKMDEWDGKPAAEIEKLLDLLCHSDTVSPRPSLSFLPIPFILFFV